MQSLSALTLEAQKKIKGVKPAVSLILEDLTVSVTRYRWQSVYSGSEAAGYHDACQADDGSIIRVRRDASGNLMRQRVTDPTQVSQWQSWTDTGYDCAAKEVVCCAQYNAATVWIFWVDSADNTIVKGMMSSNYGATFGAAETVYDAPQNIAALGGCMYGSIPHVVFGFGLNPNGGYLYCTYKTGGAWTAPDKWGEASEWYRLWGIYIGTINNDIGVLICGRPTAANWEMGSVIFGKGGYIAAGDWSAYKTIEEAQLDLPFQYKYPSWCWIGYPRAMVVGRYLGTTPVVERVHYTWLRSGEFVAPYWTDLWPTQFEAGYGLRLAWSAKEPNWVYLCSYNAAWKADLTGLSDLNLSDRLIYYKFDQPYYGDEGGPIYPLEFELDNSDGALDTAGQAGTTYELLQRGAQVELQRGYYYQGANRLFNLNSVWVESVKRYVNRVQGRSVVRVRCIGFWGLAARWRARRAYQWADGERNCFQIMEYLLGKFGYEHTSGGEESSTWSNFYPAFAIRPNQIGREVIMALLDKAPDMLLDGPFEDVTVKQFSESEASDYPYGGTGQHPILEAEIGEAALPTNHVEVFGRYSCFGEDQDLAEVSLSGHRLLKIGDMAYETNAEALTRAQGTMRKREVEVEVGWIKTRPNVGIEMFDVVTITEPSLGVSGGLYRVIRIEEEFDRRGIKPGVPRPIFEQTLYLGKR